MVKVTLLMVTEFQHRVYEVVKRIPAGSVATYASVAREIDCGCPRAVGQALKRNPFAPRVPCHRVVCTDGRLGGFAGRTDGPQIERKQRLLEKEGVSVRNGRVVKAPFWTHGNA